MNGIEQLSCLPSQLTVKASRSASAKCTEAFQLSSIRGQLFCKTTHHSSLSDIIGCICPPILRPNIGPQCRLHQGFVLKPEALCVFISSSTAVMILMPTSWGDDVMNVKVPGKVCENKLSMNPQLKGFLPFAHHTAKHSSVDFPLMKKHNWIGTLQKLHFSKLKLGFHI